MMMAMMMTTHLGSLGLALSAITICIGA